MALRAIYFQAIIYGDPVIPAPLLAGVQNIAGVTQRLRSTPCTDGLDSYVGLIALVLLTYALVDH